ncbi:hypothetical protein WKW77_34455 [Variovorax ureilyticus]|uniref:Rv2175c C-terminal domain-containing protein n=1 Tax=Variovorax ureilyticus TaxID=1836198 RepID=A0ABU8VRA7_9BURK
MMTLAEAAAELDIEASAIAKALAEGRCIGIVDSAGDLRLPIWQFEPTVWFEIELIGEQLGSVDGWTLLQFLEVPSASLEGISPRMALERGVPRERVLAAAASYAH